MKRDEVLAILAAHREPLQRLGVKSLTLFGSVARDEARPDSDVDLLVEFNQQGGFFSTAASAVLFRRYPGMFCGFRNSGCLKRTFTRTCTGGCYQCPLEIGDFAFETF